jgi:hypothetical protein
MFGAKKRIINSKEIKKRIGRYAPINVMIEYTEKFPIA